MLQEQDTGLEAPFPLTVKESGKATVQIVRAPGLQKGDTITDTLAQSQKDLPIQLRIATKPLKASVVLASFGSSQGLDAPVFEVKVEQDANAPPPAYEKPLRYGKQPEIHHIFRPDAKSPPKVVSLAFGLAVAAALPALLISVSHTRQTTRAAILTPSNSGLLLAGTSTTYPKLLVWHRCRMPPFSARSWRWSLSSSCTTPPGTYSRCFRSWAWSAQSLC